MTDQYIVIIIPILLIAILTLSFSASFSGGSSGFRGFSVEEYFDEMQTDGNAAEAVIAGKVREWINSLDIETDHAYALRYDHAAEDGFEIIIEYKDLVPHDDMLHCFVLEQNGRYYIIDDRTDGGRFIREIDETFYNNLAFLFDSSLPHTPN